MVLLNLVSFPHRGVYAGGEKWRNEKWEGNHQRRNNDKTVSDDESLFLFVFLAIRIG